MRAYTSVLSPAEFTSTATGSISDLDFNNANILRLNNASGGLITGIKAGYPGQILTVISLSGIYGFSHEDASSSAANRLINFVSGVSTIINSGLGTVIYQYDGVSQRWRLISHFQCDLISYVSIWYNLVTQPAIGNGTKSSYYLLNSRIATITINLSFGSTSTFGTGGLWLFSLPSNFTASVSPVGSGIISTGGGANIYTLTCSITTAFHAAGDIFAYIDTTGAGLSDLAPVVVGAGDFLRLSIPNVQIT